MITELFIKQCEQAEEIQKLRYYRRGDWFYTEKHRNDVTNGFHIICDDYSVEECNDNWLIRAKGVWLPTQEQLQEMINWKDYDIKIYWNSAPYKFYWQQDPLEMYGANGDSMNEFWLMYVMKKKYNKIWNGDDWK